MDAVIDRDLRGEGTLESAWAHCSTLAQLPSRTAGSLLQPGIRALVVAPHPDDEVLAVGGLLAQLVRGGMPVEIIAVTDGTASHLGSSEWPTQRLARERPRESRSALARLGVRGEPTRLGLPDGNLAALRDELTECLLRIIEPHHLVFTTWRQDGHPDHEATGDACACAAARRGVRLVEVPVWAWHWASPGDARLPWTRAWRVPLDADAASRKRHAVQAFRSQLTHDASTGAAPILRATTVERAARPYEVMFA